MSGTGTSTFAGKIVEGRTVIKILPIDFIATDEATVANASHMEEDATNKGIKPTASTVDLVTYVDVPLGYTATKVRLYGDDAHHMEVYTLDLTDGTVGSEISDGGLQVNANTNLTTNHVGSDTNLLFIQVLTTAITDVIYGGAVTIQAT